MTKRGFVVLCMACTVVLSACSADIAGEPLVTTESIVIPPAVPTPDDLQIMTDLYTAYPVNDVTDSAAFQAAEVWVSEVDDVTLTNRDDFLFFPRLACFAADMDGGFEGYFLDFTTVYEEGGIADLNGVSYDGVAAFVAATFAATQQICPQHFGKAQEWLEQADEALAGESVSSDVPIEAEGGSAVGTDPCPSQASGDIGYLDVVSAGYSCANNPATLGEPFNEAVYCGGYAQAAAYEGSFPELDSRSMTDREYRDNVNSVTFHAVIESGECVATNGSAFSTFPEAWCSGFEKAAFDVGSNAGMPRVKEYFVDWESQIGGEGYQRCVEESWWQYPNIVDHVLENG